MLYVCMYVCMYVLVSYCSSCSALQMYICDHYITAQCKFILFNVNFTDASVCIVMYVCYCI